MQSTTDSNKKTLVFFSKNAISIDSKKVPKYKPRSASTFNAWTSTFCFIYQLFNKVARFRTTTLQTTPSQLCQAPTHNNWTH